jgi:hypothetical protein
VKPISLRDISEPTIAIDCRKCGRHGEYNVEKLCQRYSPDLLLTVLVDIASRDCDLRTKPGQTDRCGAFCGELEARRAGATKADANAYARAKAGE